MNATAIALLLVAASTSEAATAPAPQSQAQSQAQSQDAPREAFARSIGPAGTPIDLLPIAPLGGVLGYLVEAGAAAGVSRALAHACLVPIVGPVVYFVLAPQYIADAIEFVATRYTTTGLGDRKAALLAAFVVEGVAALFMLGAQALVIGEGAAIALLVVGLQQDNTGLVQTGTAIAVGGGLGALALLALSPLAIAAGIGGPHLEAMAFRSFDLNSVAPELKFGEPGDRVQ